GHRGAWARPTRSLELQHHDKAVYLMECHVSPVGHQARPHLMQNLFHILFS
ncbi:hypothetical protein CRG98_049248, partial [Punica granatum]